MNKSHLLQQKIQRAIDANGGCLSFALFMHMALYEPGLGYYVSGLRKFGAQGDFVTAPELSSAFSDCVAKQCQEILAKLTTPSILEFGAGSGIMAADILLYLEKQSALPVHYFIVDVSPDLRARQEEMLRNKCSHLFSKVRWLNEFPQDFVGVVLANEVLDAMPVHLFRIQKGKACEIGVTSDFTLMLLENELPITVSLPEGYQSECCLAVGPWLQDLYASMEQGVVLLVDYGFPESVYYHPERRMGTLMCHYQHRAHTDPFIHLGLQDITAHVNFTAVARAAEKSGFFVSGYTSQAHFLMALGIEQALLHEEDVVSRYRLAQAIKRLLLPTEMGELFQVMALSKGVEENLLIGFSLSDQRYRLFTAYNG